MERVQSLPDKEAFFADLGYVPHPGQLAIHRSKAPRRIVACGARWGKTLCAAMEALAAAVAPAEHAIGWVVAPTYDLADRVFQLILLMARTHLLHHIVALKESERRLVLRNMGGGLTEIRAKSADNPTSLLGEGLSFCVIDEASRIKPKIWQAYLSQRLVDHDGWALLISTPHGKGYFYDLFRRGQGGDPDFESWNAPSWDNPHLDRASIERERDRTPEQVYREQYRAEFLEGTGAVFRGVRDCATGTFQSPIPGERYYAGLDLAKSEDFTVLVIVDRHLRVVYVDRFQRLDWDIQINRIQAATSIYNNARTTVDTTGIGEPIYERLVRAGIRATPYCITTKSKSDLINNLALRFEEGRITLPTPDLWEIGIDELESFQYSVTDAGHYRSGAPSGYHDDCVIALALAIREPSPRLRRVTFIAKYRNPKEMYRILRRYPFSRGGRFGVT